MRQVGRAVVQREDARDRVFNIESARPAAKFWIVKFEETRGRPDAEALTGARLSVFREELPPLAEDEFYIADIYGFEVFDGDECLGRIVSSRSQGGVEILIVQGDAAEIQVPMVDDYVSAVRLEIGRVELIDAGTLPRSSLSGTRRRS
jgi:16S rRNA processing protein RimM